jgi:hypothetical protein
MIVPPAVQQPARAGAAGVFAGLIIILVLQLLQVLIDSFEPRLAVKLLLFLAVGLTTVAFEILRTNNWKWRQRWFIAPAIAAFGVLVATGLVTAAGGVTKEAPPTVDEQIVRIQREGTAGERKRVRAMRVDFHGSGTPSYVFVFADEFQGGTLTPRSAEIRVYDRVGKRLELRFRFRPRPVAWYATEGDQVLDVDRDGDQELIGGLLPPGGAVQPVVPFFLHWSEEEGAYRIAALEPQRPPLGRNAEARQYRAAYTSQLSWSDPVQRASVKGFPVQDFTVFRNPPGLAVSYILRPADARGGALRVEAGVFNWQSRAPSLIPCVFRGLPSGQASTPPAPLDYRSALTRAVKRAGACRVEL